MPSDLQVSNLKDLTGSNTGLSIASDGQVTVNQNNPTITLGANVTFPTGHILQTVSTFVAGNFSTASSSYTDVTGVSRAITPRKTGSKILVFLSCSLGGGVSNTQGSLQLQRDIASGGYSVVGGGTAEGSRVSGIAQVAITPNEGTNQVGYHFVDEPSYSSGNTITYKLMAKAQSGGYDIFIGNSRSDGNAVYNTRMPTVLTVMEIAG